MFSFQYMFFFYIIHVFRGFQYMFFFTIIVKWNIMKQDWHLSRNVLKLHNLCCLCYWYSIFFEKHGGWWMAKSDVTKNALADSLKRIRPTRPLSESPYKTSVTAHKYHGVLFLSAFFDKYELLNWMFLNDYRKQNSGERPDNIWEIYLNTCRYIYQDQQVYRNAPIVTGQNSFRSFCTQLMTPLLKENFIHEFKPNQNWVFFINILTNASWDALYYWLNETPCQDPG